MMQDRQPEKTSFLKRWFPTFVHLFGQFSGDKSVASGSSPDIKPVKLVNQSVNQGILKEPPREQSFFLQGLDDLEAFVGFSREDCLQGLGWESHGLQGVTGSRAEVIPTTAFNFEQSAQIELPKLELSPPQIMGQPIEQDSESNGFFLRGLRSISDVENMKNMELLALLRWEEQGQTLLEVDPDDYDLLDDLLEAAEI
jgi:hypothetical protein